VGSATFSGTVQIDVTVHEKVDQIVLNAAELAISDVEVRTASGEVIPCTVSFEEIGQVEQHRGALGRAQRCPSTLGVAGRRKITGKMLLNPGHACGQGGIFRPCASAAATVRPLHRGSGGGGRSGGSGSAVIGPLAAGRCSALRAPSSAASAIAAWPSAVGGMAPP